MNSLSKNALYKMTLNIFNIALPFIIGPYALRVLGSEVMGNIYYSESIFGYFFVFSCFGIYQYGIRELSSVRTNKKRLKEKFTSLFIISVLASLVTLTAYFIFIKYQFSGRIQFNILQILSINIISNMLYVEWAVEALEEYKFITIKSIIVKSLYILLLIMLVKEPSHYKIYLFLFVGSSMLNNLISFFYITHKIKFSISNIEITRHILPLIIVVLMSNVNTLFTQLDRVFLGTFTIDKINVSYYSIPQGITAAINGLLQSILIVTIPRLSNVLCNGNKNEYESIIKKNNKIFFTLLIPIVIGIICIADKIILIYAGDGYHSSIITMRIFTIYLFTLGIEYILTNQIMYVNKKEKLLFVFIMISGICNIIFKCILVKLRLLTPSSAILTTVLANLVLIILELIYIKYKLELKLKIFDSSLFKNFSITLLFIPITYMVNYFNLGILSSMLIIIILCSTLYFLFNKEILLLIMSLLLSKKDKK